MAGCNYFGTIVPLEERVQQIHNFLIKYVTNSTDLLCGETCMLVDGSQGYLRTLDLRLFENWHHLGRYSVIDQRRARLRLFVHMRKAAFRRHRSAR
jgi:hypothetical protein